MHGEANIKFACPVRQMKEFLNIIQTIPRIFKFTQVSWCCVKPTSFFIHFISCRGALNLSVNYVRVPQ